MNVNLRRYIALCKWMVNDAEEVKKMRINLKTDFVWDALLIIQIYMRYKKG